ncbi:unnamed protein product [Camellia sinensis]
MRPQALSSYVFIAANVILHASATVQSCYLVELIPPIIPLLTSHHHSLRGFTQDVREDLRCSMAKDAETIKNESLSINKDPKCVELSINADKDKLQAQLPKDIPLDFQKKVIIAKHEKQEANSDIFLGKNETYKRLMGM